MNADERSLRVAFVHPDLGIGGAERLVIDAASALQRRGHTVRIFTAHHDPERCFDATRDGSLDVRVHGSFLPLHVGQRLRVPCAVARMSYLAFALRREPEGFDVIFCDLVAHAMPLLRMRTGAKLIFYCHFPDKLLSPPRRGWYRLYRAPIDRLEEWSTGRADRILVNSAFTATTFRAAFPGLAATPLEVLHPGIDPETYAEAAATPFPAAEITLLSLSRFEPSKGLDLAVDAFARLQDLLLPAQFDCVRLVMAGGFDPRKREEQGVVEGLRAQAQRLGVGSRVQIVLSPDDAARMRLLTRARCVVYTPEKEHFGFVPLEAMAAARPVIAVRSGGPLETVIDGKTGFLCAPTPAAFAQALARVVAGAAEARRLGEAGRRHVRDHFSLASFGDRLERIVTELTAGSVSLPSDVLPP